MTIPSAEMARLLGWEWPCHRTVMDLGRLVEQGVLQPAVRRRSVSAQYTPLDLLVARVVLAAWPIVLGDRRPGVNKIRKLAADTVRAGPHRRWLVVVRGEGAFMTDDAADVLGHGPVMTTVVDVDALRLTPTATVTG